MNVKEAEESEIAKFFEGVNEKNLPPPNLQEHAVQIWTIMRAMITSEHGAHPNLLDKKKKRARKQFVSNPPCLPAACSIEFQQSCDWRPPMAGEDSGVAIAMWERGLHTPIPFPHWMSLSPNRPPMAGKDSGAAGAMWERGLHTPTWYVCLKRYFWAGVLDSQIYQPQEKPHSRPENCYPNNQSNP